MSQQPRQSDPAPADDATHPVPGQRRTRRMIGFLAVVLVLNLVFTVNALNAEPARWLAAALHGSAAAILVWLGIVLYRRWTRLVHSDATGNAARPPGARI